MNQMRRRLTHGLGLVLWTLAAAFGCGGDARIEACEPENACSCGPGTERETSCSCTGGSSCEIEGDDIEFQCDGNAGCGMSCGNDCLITCPGTTTCDIEVGDRGVIECPGTATCNVACHGSCTLSLAGAARAVLVCEDDAADCEMSGCQAVDCGDGVFACRTECPSGRQ